MLAKKKRWNSIRWRIVLIYFLLVFIAMTIIGVVIMNQLEDYQMQSVEKNLTKIVKESMIYQFQGYDDLSANQAAIQTDIDTNWSSKSFQEEIFIVDPNFVIVASNNKSAVGKRAGNLLSASIIVSGLQGKIAKDEGQIVTTNANNSSIPVKNLVFPIRSSTSGKITGVIYLRADVSGVYQMLSESKSIFAKAMLLALCITVLLGFLIARSITVPINDVTEKAERMSRGDFSQEVSVKSDDEIGRLAEMFNLLRQKLDLTLSEINSEKSKLETILKYMADGLIAVDSEGQIIHANPAGRTMLAITEADIQTKRWDEIIRAYSEALCYDQLLEKSREGGNHMNFQFGGQTYAVGYDRFQDESEQESGIIMLFQDVTEKQKLENMQSDFVANVSHELKTPITTIKSYTETLLDGGVEDKETALSFLAIVETEADRMNRLVKDLLQLSRLDYKQEKLFQKESNLVSLLKSAVTRIELSAINKRQHLNCIFDQDQMIMAVVDKDRIEQVLLNILSNAIKYTPEEGRIDIDILTAERQARIMVTDNGIGIAEHEIPRVFERFYRVDKARSRTMGGTGLGLAISRQIVEAHRGSISLESQEGKGTKAIITLPLAPRRGRSNIE